MKLGPNFLATVNAHADWEPRLSGASWVIIGITLVAVFAVDVFKNISPYWLYGSYSIPRLNVAASSAMLLRVGLYFCSVIIGLAFINMLPWHKLRFSNIGRNSIYVLVWHGFPLILLSYTRVRTVIFAANDGFAIAISICYSLLIVAIFGHCWSASATDRFIFNPLAKLLMAESLPSAQVNGRKMAARLGGSYNAAGPSGHRRNVLIERLQAVFIPPLR